MRNKARKGSYDQQEDERRRNERRGKGERRDMVRWEPAKPSRRKKRDRRKSAGASWDDALTRRR